MSHRALKSSIVTGLVVAAAAVLVAGPLDPPAGPVTGTYKTLTEVEPRIAVNAANTPGDADSLFKITLPGSYYLTGNIAGVVGKHGVEIAASGVTLDLNGFDLAGAAGSLDGVSLTVALLNNIAVVNGSVRSWAGDGVDLYSSGGLTCRLADLRAQGNAGNGMGIGQSGSVSGCAAYQNGGSGIITGSSSTVTNCAAFGNTISGINLYFYCTISGCTAAGGSTASIIATGNCSITGCVASNGSTGISAGFASTITGCTVSYSNGNGLTAGFGSTITDCTAQGNLLDGIRVTSGCVVRGNTCSTNGNGGDAAGIHATSNDNRIEGNNCTGADRGIGVDAAGNIIIKNTCSGNTTNWVIAASNYYGPIIDRTGVVTAAVSGPAAASTLATTDANANFSY